MVKSRSFLKLLSGIRVLCDNLQMNPLLTRLSVESEMERLHAVSREAGYEKYWDTSTGPTAAVVFSPMVEYAFWRNRLQRVFDAQPL